MCLGSRIAFIAIARDTSPFHSKPLNERYRLWLLKNSRFAKIAEIWDVENV